MRGPSGMISSWTILESRKLWRMCVAIRKYRVRSRKNLTSVALSACSPELRCPLKYLLVVDHPTESGMNEELDFCTTCSFSTLNWETFRRARSRISDQRKLPHPAIIMLCESYFKRAFFFSFGSNLWIISTVNGLFPWIPVELAASEETAVPDPLVRKVVYCSLD